MRRAGSQAGIEAPGTNGSVRARPLLRGGMALGEAAFLLLDSECAKLDGLRRPVLQGEDPEAVHDMRVAARRIRAALKVFKVVFPETLVSQDKEVKWIFGELGEVRDLDIVLERLRKLGEAHQNDSKAISTLARAVARRRDAAKAALRKNLDSERFKKLMEVLKAELGKGPSSRRTVGAAPVLAAAPDLIESSFRKVERIGEKLDENSKNEDFHRLRKQAKRFRYTLEFFASLYGKPGEELVACLKDFQDRLGERQDFMAAAAIAKSLLDEDSIAQSARPFAKRQAGRWREDADALKVGALASYAKVARCPWKRLKGKIRKERKALWKGIL